MSDHEETSREPQPDMTAKIGAKEQRKLKARQNARQTIWFGLGMFGMVGWSVAIPTVMGIAIGAWLDRTFQDEISWTLTGLFTGVIIGGIMAWSWVNQEGRPS